MNAFLASLAALVVIVVASWGILSYGVDLSAKSTYSTSTVRQ